MGQYRLWLQHREIDQLLRAQLKTLVNELAQVDEQIRLLASSTIEVDNVIIQALLKEFEVGKSSVPVPDASIQAILSPAVDLTLVNTADLQEQKQPSGSSVPFTWGHLPSFTSRTMQNSATETTLSQRVPPTPLSTENLLPSDIQKFVAAYSPAAPQMKTTRKLTDITSPAHQVAGNGPASPVDQQSIRVNQGVERWFERRIHILQGSGSNQEEQKEGIL